MTGVLPYEVTFSAKIENGSLYGERGYKGTAGSSTIRGRISADGTGTIMVAGLSGDTKTSYRNMKTGTHYSYPATVRLQGRSGTGRRTDGLRECNLIFEALN